MTAYVPLHFGNFCKSCWAQRAVPIDTEGWSHGRRYELRRLLVRLGIRMVHFEVFSVMVLRYELAFMAVTMPDSCVLALVVNPLLV